MTEEPSRRFVQAHYDKGEKWRISVSTAGRTYVQIIEEKLSWSDHRTWFSSAELDELARAIDLARAEVAKAHILQSTIRAMSEEIPAPQ